MNCPGSIRLIEQLPSSEKDRGSKYAREGNAAHGLAAICLLNQKSAEEFRGWYVVEMLDGEWLPVIPTSKPAGEAFEVTDEMIEAIDEYTASVWKSVHALGRDAELQVEVRVQPLPRDDMFGTADAIVYKPFGPLVVHDLKYGKGIQVEAERNPQTMYYGLGALRAAGGWEMVESAEMVINQPRAGGERRFALSPRELAEWGDTLGAAADRTRDPKAPLAAGEWCRFCPAAGRCPELKQTALEAAQASFLADPLPSTLVPAPSYTLTVPDAPEAVGRALAIIPVIDVWAREVEGQAQRLLERGIAVPGYKLVRKRANRKWADETATRLDLELAGLTPEQYNSSPELKSPAQIEKLTALGKPAARKALVETLTIKPEGGLTLTAESDPRPAEKPPVALFSEIPIQLPPGLDNDGWIR
jgi:hypothetical protein